MSKCVGGGGSKGASCLSTSQLSAPDRFEVGKSRLTWKKYL